MKILFISMPSIHAIRWIENLSSKSFELYWFDILDRGKLDTNIEIKQFVGWKKRKVKYIRGEFWLSKNMPSFYSLIEPFLVTNKNEALESIIKNISPDIIHSFEMHHCTYPILKTMNKFPLIKWVYSSWGSDLFYYKDTSPQKEAIRKSLERIDFFHSDNKRDFIIAKENGYHKGKFSVIPGGGGYDIEKYTKYSSLQSSRKVILVKGYEHKFGRALNVVKALANIKSKIKEFEVIVFGAHPKVISYIKQNNLTFKYYERNELTQNEVLKLMGKSKIYIGNSISDGMPNTLLEALIMGVFPIQSNPGNVTAEIIEDKVNGLLINDPEDVKEISNTILFALHNDQLIQEGNRINKEIVNDKLGYKKNQKKIIDLYKL